MCIRTVSVFSVHPRGTQAIAYSERMTENDISSFTGELQLFILLSAYHSGVCPVTDLNHLCEHLTIPDNIIRTLTTRIIPHIRPLRVIIQPFYHVRDTIFTDIRPSASWDDISEKLDHYEALFSTIEEVIEPVTINMPVAKIARVLFVLF
jgi:hypothetical protein